jgi:hypothetical protein
MPDAMRVHACRIMDRGCRMQQVQETGAECWIQNTEHQGTG